jgi:hypothetical protein
MSPMPNFFQQQMQRQQEMWREQRMKAYWWEGKKREEERARGRAQQAQLHRVEEEAKRLRSQFERGAIDHEGYRQGLQDLKIPVGTTSPQRSHRFLKVIVILAVLLFLAMLVFG